MIVILDYGIGNVASVQNMFKKIGVASVISDDISVISKADKLLLPGVGKFDYGISKFKSAPFFATVEDMVLHQKTPILGICLGAQMLTEKSEEGDLEGLGWIPAETKKFSAADFSALQLPIPHMGWNTIKFDDNQPLFRNLDPDARFYFVHSYYMKSHSPENEICSSQYSISFSSGIHSQNIYGVQFHPEKSLRHGMAVLRNFSDL